MNAVNSQPGFGFSEDLNKLNLDKNIDNIKTIRALNNIVEFKIGNQPLKINKNDVYPHQITKTIRVTLPDSTRVDLKKYGFILNELVDQAKEIAANKNHKFTEADLKKARIKSKKTGLRWKLVPKKKSFISKVLKFLSRIGIFKMTHTHKNQGVVELVLKESSPWYTKIFGISRKRQIAIKAFKGSPNLPKVPYDKNEKKEDLFAGFKDPFTKVASYAYKYLESDFAGKDHANIDHISSDYQFILEDKVLTLVHKNDFVPNKKAKVAAALSEFKAHFFAEYGKQKCDYLTLLARIDFSKLTTLTPEHVYRLNVLACNTESQDIESLVHKMRQVKNQIADSNEPLSFNDIQNVDLSSSEKRSMVKWAKLQQGLNAEVILTASEFKSAVEKLGNAESKNIEDSLDQEQVNQLIQAIRPTAEERKKSYTGRQITKPIATAYTLADRKIYKSWVEQQEVSQTFDLLENDFRYDPYDNKNIPLSQDEKDRRFNEYCTNILCKKHLFRPHPTEGFRVGALIPAPSDINGNKRWYSVNLMTANEEGLLFYVLEPVGKDSGLETMIVARSTASDEYAFQNAATIRNDMNPLNAPGYEGRRHLKQSLGQVRKEHTIPTWVGYQYLAGLELKKEKCDLTKVQDQLVQSKNAIEKDLISNHGVKSLHEIIRHFDGEFNDVMWKNLNKKHFKDRIFKRTVHSKYQKLIYRFSHEYSKQMISDEEKVDRMSRLKEEREAAKDLIQYMTTFGTKDKEGKLVPKFQEVVDALQANIIEPSEAITNKNIILKNYLPEKLKKAFELINTSPTSLDSLRNAEALLSEHAKSIGEDVNSKKKNGILLAGHSLGGSSAQVEAYFSTAGSNRVPVPGTKMRVALYDDPGMNEEDNIDMHEFLFNHRAMIKELNINFEVYHSHDYGDVVAMGAPAHLGGISSKVDARLLEKYRKEIKINQAAHTSELINWLKKRFPSEIKPVDLDKLREFKQKMPLKNSEWEAYFNFHRQSGFAHLTPLDFFSSGKDGKNEILKFIKEGVQNSFRVLTEIKTNTNHTLESETSDIQFKHGTRYEMTRKEKELLFNIASGTKEKIRNNKQIVNFRTLGNFVKECYGMNSHETEAFIKDFDLFELLKIKIRDKKVITNEELQNFNTLFPEISEKMVKDGVVKPKALSLIEKSIKKKHYNVLKLAFKDYKQLLSNQAEKVQERTTGGVRVTHVNQEILGSLGGKGDLSRKTVRKIWGGGWIDGSRIQGFAKFLGMEIGPNFYGRVATENKKNKNFERKGFRDILKFQNSHNGSLSLEK